MKLSLTGIGATLTSEAVFTAMNDCLSQAQ